MILGLRFGNTDSGDTAAIERTEEAIEEFVAEFESRNDTIKCAEILGTDVSTENGLKYALEQCMIADICPNLVRDAAEILETVLRGETD